MMEWNGSSEANPVRHTEPERRYVYAYAVWDRSYYFPVTEMHPVQWLTLYMVDFVDHLDLVDFVYHLDLPC